MTARVVVTDQEDSPRQSRRVRTVAAMLDADERQVRRLIEDGELETHGIGKRGLRVYLDSVKAYQDRQNRKSTHLEQRPMGAPARRAASTAAHRAALADLRRDGILP